MTDSCLYEMQNLLKHLGEDTCPECSNDLVIGYLEDGLTISCTQCDYRDPITG